MSATNQDHPTIQTSSWSRPRRNRPVVQTSNWGPASSGSSADEGDNIPAGQGDSEVSASVGIFSLLVSMPALMGVWCWPVLLAGFLSGAASIASAEAKMITHIFSWAINMTIFSNMVQYLGNKGQKGPSYCVGVGGLLILVDNTRHILNDVYGNECDKVSNVPGAEFLPPQYATVCVPTGFASMENEDGSYSTWGWIGLICTWVGFLFFIYGIGWSIDFRSKLRQAWRARSERRNLANNAASANDATDGRSVPLTGSA